MGRWIVALEPIVVSRCFASSSVLIPDSSPRHNDVVIEIGIADVVHFAHVELELSAECLF